MRALFRLRRGAPAPSLRHRQNIGKMRGSLRAAATARRPWLCFQSPLNQNGASPSAVFARQLDHTARGGVGKVI